MLARRASAVGMGGTSAGAGAAAESQLREEDDDDDFGRGAKVALIGEPSLPSAHPLPFPTDTHSPTPPTNLANARPHIDRMLVQHLSTPLSDLPPFFDEENARKTTRTGAERMGRVCRSMGGGCEVELWRDHVRSYSSFPFSFLPD